MAKKARKPKGWRNFTGLLGKLVEVPKDEVDSQVERSRKSRKRKKK